MRFQRASNTPRVRYSEQVVQELHFSLIRSLEALLWSDKYLQEIADIRDSLNRHSWDALDQPSLLYKLERRVYSCIE